MLWACTNERNCSNEIVTPFCGHVISRGIPLPKNFRQVQVSTTDLEALAKQSAQKAQDSLRRKVDCNDMEVTCRYLGAAAPGGVDVNARLHTGSKVMFKWTLQSEEFVWHEEVSMRVKDTDHRKVPLPRCTVSHQRLSDAAKDAAKKMSDKFSISVSCT